MSDSGGSSSSDWAMVDDHGSLTDDDTASTTSSLEVVNDEEDEEMNQATPLVGSPNSVGPCFVLRIPSHESEDTDEDTNETSTSLGGSQYSDLGTVSSYMDTDLSSRVSTSSTVNVPKQADKVESPTSTQISAEQLEDLMRTLDALKKQVQSQRPLTESGGRVEVNKCSEESSNNSMSSMQMFGDGEPDRNMLVENIGANVGQEGFLEAAAGSRGLFVDAGKENDLTNSTEFIVTEGNADEDSPISTVEDTDGPDIAVLEEVKVQERESILTRIVTAVKGVSWTRYLVAGFVFYAGTVVLNLAGTEYSPCNQCAKLRQMFHLQNEDYRTLSDEKKTLIEQLQTAEEYKNKLIRENTHLQGSTDTLENLFTIWKNKADTFREKHRELKHEYESLLIDKKQIEADLDQENTELKAEKDKLEERVKQLQKEVELIKDKHQDLVLDYETLSAENGQMKADLEYANKQLNKPVDLTDKCSEFVASLKQCQLDINIERKRYHVEQDNIKGQAEEDLNKVRVQCQNDLEQIRQQCQKDLSSVRNQCQNDLNNIRREINLEIQNKASKSSSSSREETVKSASDNCERNQKCKSADDNGKKQDYQSGEKFHKYQSADDNRKKEDYQSGEKFHKYQSADDNRKKQDQSGEKFHKYQSADDNEKKQDQSGEKFHKYQSADDNGKKQDYHSEYSGARDNDNFSRFWTDTLMDMIFKTQGHIENTWLKMKDMSKSFWREHEPAVYQIRDELVQKVHHFGDKLHEKLSKKFDKWAKKAKKWHNRDSEADNRREDFKDNKTLEEILVEASYKINRLNVRKFNKLSQDMFDIQSDLQYINSRALPAHKQGNSNLTLTDQQMKWLNCQLQWWNVLGVHPVLPDCVMSLCCWQVKIYGGNPKQCSKLKRKQGLFEDTCSLDLAQPLPEKEKIDQSNCSKESSNPSQSKTMKKTVDNARNAGTKLEDDWYSARARNRQFHRDEPDNWFFRRKNRRERLTYLRNKRMYSPPDLDLEFDSMDRCFLG